MQKAGVYPVRKSDICLLKKWKKDPSGRNTDIGRKKAGCRVNAVIEDLKQERSYPN